MAGEYACILADDCPYFVITWGYNFTFKCDLGNSLAADDLKGHPDLRSRPYDR